MEQTPADAHAAPSASAPNDVDMGIPSSPKRPRDPAQDNKVSQRATPIAPAMACVLCSCVGSGKGEGRGVCATSSEPNDHSMSPHSSVSGLCRWFMI
eukprot:scaffold9726_cov119-Isochrysis_galbana.AAC.7